LTEKYLTIEKNSIYKTKSAKKTLSVKKMMKVETEGITNEHI